MTDTPQPITHDEMLALAAALGRAGADEIAAHFHPLANIFPLMGEAERRDLGESLAENGQREKIVLLDGLILDGRNRAIELRRRGLTVHLRHYDPKADGPDPVKFIVDRNLRRRQLNDDQRRMVAARLANLAVGVKEADAANGGISREQAATALAVDPAGVERARTVVNRGAPELQQAVDDGRMSVRAAADLATLPVAEQAEIIRGADRKALSKVIKEVRAERQAQKKQRRTEREERFGAKIAALPAKKYGVIVADPEWEFKVWSDETGKDRSAENHYPTSPTEIIAARPVGDIAADDCLLLLWATAPRLLDAIAVMQAWGFTYQTHAIGRKPNIITGYWFRFRHELMLLGTRGTVPCPAMGTQPESVFDMEVDDPEHSKKPDFAHDYAETFFPSVPKIELNARGRRPGWDAWGFEAPEEVTSNEGKSVPRFAPVKGKCCDRRTAKDDPPYFLRRVS